MVPFTYGLDGEIYAVGEPFQQLRQPSKPIPPEVTAITGIDDAMVAGQRSIRTPSAAFAAPASLVIAHNAAFDRKFLERFSDDVQHQALGLLDERGRLGGGGLRRDQAGLSRVQRGVLLRAPPRDPRLPGGASSCWPGSIRSAGAPGLAQLLERARTPTWRIWAENSPFDLKDVLKARGYRWNGEASGAPAAWYIDVDEADRDAEIAFLKSEIYRGEIDLLVRRIDAYDRFSDRV